MKQSLLLIYCFFVHFVVVLAQSKNVVKVPLLTTASFNPQSSVIDSNTQAVTLYNIGSSDFEGNSDGDFTLIYKRSSRILIKNRNAFDIATIVVPLHTGITSASEEHFESFEATTYNLENGKIIATKLDKSALLSERVNKYNIRIKFTFPNVKAGSIIEYQYVIKSPFYSRLRSWTFQNQYPCLLSEYRVTIPPMFNYVTVKQGYLSYSVDSVNKFFKHYSIVLPSKNAYGSSEYLSLSGDANFHLWSIKDVPAFKEESYTSSTDNYINQIRFQLHSIRYSDTYTQYFIKNWIDMAKELLEDEDFAKTIQETGSSWLNEITAKFSMLKGEEEKAMKTFQFVRDNYVCTNHDAIYLSQPLKKTHQSKSGNVADINMLLANLLINQGFEVHPVILSTRENGYVSEETPILNQYNYVILQLVIDSVKYYLDASSSRNGFNKLPEYCYNKSGRLIDTFPVIIELSADKIAESKSAIIVIANDDKEGLSGKVVNNLGYYESCKLRDKIVKMGKHNFLKEVATANNAEMLVENVVVDSLIIYEEPVAISYDFKIKPFEEDIVYFNPMFSLAWKSNPFKSASRIYPVEMNYKINEIYNLVMDVPKGYKVEELPKNIRVKLNEIDGVFEYLIANQGSQIQMISKLILKKANFESSDYETLRDFFGFVVKKHSEQIVFKKIK